MKSPPAFRHVAAPLDVDDKLLQALNEKLHVPTLVKSRSSPDPTLDAAPKKIAASPSPKSSKAEPSEAPKSVPTIEKDVRLAVEVPGYLRDAVNLRAAQDRSTSRYIVMQGLQAIGFEIEPADFVADGRQMTGKR